MFLPCMTFSSLCIPFVLGTQCFSVCWLYGFHAVLFGETLDTLQLGEQLYNQVKYYFAFETFLICCAIDLLGLQSFLFLTLIHCFWIQFNLFQMKQEARVLLIISNCENQICILNDFCPSIFIQFNSFFHLPHLFTISKETKPSSLKWMIWGVVLREVYNHSQDASENICVILLFTDGPPHLH